MLRGDSKSFVEKVKGKLCGDKGYIGKQLFESQFMNGIQLVPKVKNNMKNSIMTVSDKIMLRKSAVVELVNNELKTYSSDRTLKTSVVYKLHYQCPECDCRLLFLPEETVYFA